MRSCLRGTPDGTPRRARLPPARSRFAGVASLGELVSTSVLGFTFCMRRLHSLAAGRAALVRAAWAEAREQFEAVLILEETVEALEGLGVAARWQIDSQAALAAHERAYRLARESGDEVASARLAIELAFDCGQFRGAAEMNGWLEGRGISWSGFRRSQSMPCWPTCGRTVP